MTTKAGRLHAKDLHHGRIAYYVTIMQSIGSVIETITVVPMRITSRVMKKPRTGELYVTTDTFDTVPLKEWGTSAGLALFRTAKAAMRLVDEYKLLQRQALRKHAMDNEVSLMYPDKMGFTNFSVKSIIDHLASPDQNAMTLTDLMSPRSLVYPVASVHDTVGFLLSFRDIPECNAAIDSSAEILSTCREAIETAFEIYQDTKRPFPLPSASEPGEAAIPLSAELSDRIRQHNQSF